MQQGSTNHARNRKRTFLSTERNPGSDGLRKTTSRDRDDDQHRHRPFRAVFSSWRIRLLRMMQLRFLQRKPSSPRRAALVSCGFLLVLLIWKPLHIYFWGDAYHVEGGVFGRGVDHLVAVLSYERYSRRRRPDDDAPHDGADGGVLLLEYPIVKLRSNRNEIPGYSRYLEELLTRRAEKDSSNLAAAADWYQTASHASADVTRMHGRIQEWNVEIQEQEVSDTSRKVSFRSVVDRLRENGCHPGWMCHRCLAMPWWGSLEQCSWVCPPCFSSLLCSDVSLLDSDQQNGGGGEKNPGAITIEAHVKGSSCDGLLESRTIPRIVHVVGGPISSSSSLDLLQFPELVRIQNGWRAAGYSHRYYTPKSARAFVLRHYPSRFLHVYDAMQPSMFDQQHFFRLLVLFQQGGIVANADLMLEVNPDALFWTAAPTSKDTDPPQPVSFVASIDADMDVCLWDGLIAARPGHALVARAIELFYNSVVTQQLDQLEWMKSNACHDVDSVVDGKAQLWKVRSQNHGLIYHGNDQRRGLTYCMLGAAVHKAQGRNVSWINTPFHPGVYTMQSHLCPTKNRMASLVGDTILCKDEGMLLLMMSRDDTGATRLTDIDRNLLIASTDIVGVTMKSMNERANRVIRKKQAGGVATELREAIASDKRLDSRFPIQIQVRSVDES